MAGRLFCSKSLLLSCKNSHLLLLDFVIFQYMAEIYIFSCKYSAYQILPKYSNLFETP
jgi:hypothetical protein